MLYRRLVADGLRLPIPMEHLEAYINSQIGQVDSTWGSINQVSHIFAESYLLTIGAWPVSSSWEKMPQLAHLSQRDFCESVYILVRDFCSAQTAEAILPADVIRADDGPEGYGRILSANFLVRQRSQESVTSTSNNPAPLADIANQIGMAAGGIAGFGIAVLSGVVKGLLGTSKQK